MARIEKDIFPGVMLAPFHYACFTRFIGYSEECTYTVHNSFQIILGLSGTLHFEIEKEKAVISQHAGSVFVLSPGIRHRWHSEAGKNCENFMFFCDGFDSNDSTLGNILNAKLPEIVWLFNLKLPVYDYYIEKFRHLVLHPYLCNVNVMHGLLYAFCGTICYHASQIYGSLERKEMHPAITKAMDIIRQNYRNRLTLAQLSKHCGLGPSRLSELFNKAFGVSPIQYINELRLKKASQLLKYSDMNVSEISDYLGFSSVHYFSRFFKKNTGQNPSELTGAF